MSVVVKMSLRGINELMTSAPVARKLEEVAERIANAAGPGFEVETSNDHPWVARAWVQSTSERARWREYNHHVLTSAIDAGRE